MKKLLESSISPLDVGTSGPRKDSKDDAKKIAREVSDKGVNNLANQESAKHGEENKQGAKPLKHGKGE